MVKIVIPDDAPPVISGTKALAKLKEYGDVTLYTTLPASPQELLERIGQAHTVLNIRASSKFTADILKACSNLKHLAIWGTGTDNVDLNAAALLGIVVTNTPNTGTDAVAEQALALMLAVARRIPQIDAQIKRGEWVRGMLTQLRGKTLGIVGTGAIGLRMAELGRGIGMEVIAWTLHPSEEKAQMFGFSYLPSLETLLQEADVVSLHMRLSDETQRMIGAKEFALMKPTSIFINTARGPLVDQDALYHALAEGRIAGAGLDVFAKEPIPPNDPLLKLPNLVCSPHTAGTTPEALENGLNMAADNVLAFLEGETRNRVV
ncbi:MAG: phosphoglycerate dehydrogenase [Candidatus Tectomicrobia bacterium]|nr:phosphoglycerate dehydrogenase [Candidatus Tectomicrobia bacterium]